MLKIFLTTIRKQLKFPIRKFVLLTALSEISYNSLKMLKASIALIASLLLLGQEHPTFTVLEKDDKVEIRQYDSYIVAETVIEGTFEGAGNDAFHILAGYIFGKNDKGVKIDMTSPVTQQQVGYSRYLIQFMMPSEWTLETLPKPTDPRVNLKVVPSRKVAAITYHGSWSERHYDDNLLALEHSLPTRFQQTGEPIWARYNSPMALTMLRTNEILVELK
jgi:hypothetical protein